MKVRKRKSLLRTGHGAGSGQPHIEIVGDELSAPISDASAPLHRRPNGTIADSATARALGARGGAVKSTRARLVSALGLAELAADAEFGPYRDAGDEFVRVHLVSLASQAGGEVGPGPSSIVASAGLQLAASRFVSDRAAREGDPGLMKLASTLANDSRQNLLAGYELAVREGEARKRARGPVDPLASYMPREST